MIPKWLQKIKEQRKIKAQEELLKALKPLKMNAAERRLSFRQTE